MAYHSAVFEPEHVALPSLTGSEAISFETFIESTDSTLSAV